MLNAVYQNSRRHCILITRFPFSVSYETALSLTNPNLPYNNCLTDGARISSSECSHIANKQPFIINHLSFPSMEQLKYTVTAKYATLIIQ